MCPKYRTSGHWRCWTEDTHPRFSHAKKTSGSGGEAGESEAVAFHADELWRALATTALSVQRARTVAEVLKLSGEGLGELGLGVVLAEIEGTRTSVRHSNLPASPGAAALLGGAWTSLEPVLPELRRALLEGDARLVDDVAAFLGPRRALAPLADLLRAQGHHQAVLAGLTVREKLWGVLGVSSPTLRADDVGLYSLFARQLSSALEAAQTDAQLRHRTAELELVHELATAGPTPDLGALTHRALATVCRTSGSQAGALHRFDAQSGEYTLVGEAYGYAGPLMERFARFTLPADAPAALAPTSAPAASAGDGEVFAAGFRQVATVPLSIEGRRVGFLTLARADDVPYLTDELRSVEILGAQLASVLERLRLHRETSRLYADLKRSYDELGRTQAELVKHERLAALGELSAVMAHEVRNPLGVIFNSLATLKRLYPSSGDAAMLLTMVEEEADRLNRIVGDLLDFARPFELSRQPIDVEPLVRGAVEAAQRNFPHSAVRLAIEVQPKIPPVVVDGQLVRQALVNLIVNALQAMPKAGTIVVRAATDRGALVFTIVDQGTGLASTAAERMFQPFFTTKATGTGLGLAVVKRIVDAHQGEVSAQSNLPGPGTTFVVRLPLATGL